MVFRKITSYWSAHGEFAGKRQKVYKLLASFYNYPPKGQECLTLAKDIITDNLCDNNDMNNGIQKMQNIARLINQGNDKENLYELLGVEWTKLFRGIKPGYGPPPPKESSYKLLNKNSLIDEYAHFGLEISPSIHEEADYLGVELDFLSQVINREKLCWELGLEEEAYQLMNTEHLFLINHLWSWVPKYCVEALPFASHDFGEGIIYLTRGFLHTEMEWHVNIQEEVMKRVH